MSNTPIVTYNHDAGNYGVFQKDEDGQWVVLFSYDNHADAIAKRNHLITNTLELL